MATTRGKRKPGTAGEPVASRDKQLLLQIFETMAMMRAAEDRMVAMYRSGDLLGSLYTGHWHEAIAVGTASALRQDDFLAKRGRGTDCDGFMPVPGVQGPQQIAGHWHE